MISVSTRLTPISFAARSQPDWLRFRSTPDRGWYEDLDSSKTFPRLIECASTHMFLEYSQYLVRLSNENTGGGE
jgi:hypothetical protein